MSHPGISIEELPASAGHIWFAEIGAGRIAAEAPDGDLA